MYLSSLKVASIHYRAVAAEKAGNIGSLSRLVTEAALNGARLIVLPEMCTTGFTIENSAVAGDLAESVPGPATQTFSTLASRYNIYIVLGMAEYDPAANKFYNAQIIIAPDGQILGKYRKIHLFGTDYNWAEPGNLGYQAVDVAWGRIGLGICFDINYREFLDFMAGAQVDIFAFSANWVADELPFSFWSEMVAQGGYHLVAANNWGREGETAFSGGSMIMAPDLILLSQTDAAANMILYADIDIKRV